MKDFSRPILGLDRSKEPIDDFVKNLQDAIDTGDARLFNLSFAQDVLWGSPFGMIACGYEQIHSIHSRMFAAVTPVKGASRYGVEQFRFLSDDVAIAFVRRLAIHRVDFTEQDKPGSFDELALLVLVKRDEIWWLAAAQHVPDRREIYTSQLGINKT